MTIINDATSLSVTLKTLTMFLDSSIMILEHKRHSWQSSYDDHNMFIVQATPHLHIENIINLFYKTTYLFEEAYCTKPSPSVSVSWAQCYKKFMAVIYEFSYKARVL
jgi:hypothetical protein